MRTFLTVCLTLAFAAVSPLTAAAEEGGSPLLQEQALEQAYQLAQRCQNGPKNGPDTPEGRCSAGGDLYSHGNRYTADNGCVYICAAVEGIPGGWFFTGQVDGGS